MHVHMNDVVISQGNSIANNKSPLPSFDETIPGRVLSFWTHQQGLSRHYQNHARDVCKGICNKMILHFPIIVNMGF